MKERKEWHETGMAGRGILCLQMGKGTGVHTGRRILVLGKDGRGVFPALPCEKRT